MSPRLCSVHGCKTLAAKRGWCGTHYQRWRLHGDPTYSAQRGPVPSPPVDRVLARVVHDGDCWIYTGSPRALHPDVVVGSNLDGSRRKARAYRVVYEAKVGPIPDGFVVHHKCHRGKCVNPAHLEVMSRGDHTAHHKPRLKSTG